LIVVDSSVWIDFFRGASTPAERMLRDLIPRQTILVGDLILAEVLQGFRFDREFEVARERLQAFEAIDIVGTGIAVAAARNYRFLRSRGATVRKTIDALIATRCIEDGHTLLYSDRDFDPFVTHLGLRSALPIEPF
jgi:predicted nucleic acid-binding protein